MVIKLQIKRLFPYSASYPQALLLVSAKRVARMATIRKFYGHIPLKPFIGNGLKL